MKNPWEEIALSDYENHMSLDSVYQLQRLSQVMKEQLFSCPAKSVMILGIAGGNGLEHIGEVDFEAVYGVDINRDYLAACAERYQRLKSVFKPICADLTKENPSLPHADLLIADLLVEYIGLTSFQQAVKQVEPRLVSVVIQINTGEGFVSDSPYLHAFDRISEVHHQMEEAALTAAMSEIGYAKKLIAEHELPNGKKLVRLDFAEMQSLQ